MQLARPDPAPAPVRVFMSGVPLVYDSDRFFIYCVTIEDSGPALVAGPIYWA